MSFRVTTPIATAVVWLSLTATVFGASAETPLSVAEKSLRQQRQHYIDSLVLQSSAEMGALGAALTFAVCRATGGSKDDKCGAKALLAGFATFLSQHKASSERVHRKEGSVGKVEAAATALEREVAALRMLTETAATAADENMQQIARLRRDVTARQASTAADRKRYAEIERDVNEVTAALAAARTELKGWEALAKAQRKDGRQISRLVQLVDAKRGEVAKLEAIETVMLDELQSLPGSLRRLERNEDAGLPFGGDR